MAAINPENIWVLSALDKLMADSKDKPETFVALFQKKKTILQLLQSMKIDAKKYKTIVGKAYKDESGQVKKCAESDLLRCKDGKSEEMVELWFKEMIENTGAPYEQQQKLYQQYKNKLSAKSNVQTFSASTNSSTVSKSSNDGQNLIDSLVSFKSIDDLLEKNEDNKEQYTKLLERKQKLVGLVKSKALTAQKYKATLETYITKVTNQELRSDYKFELEGIEDFHDGNVTAWFKEIIEESIDKLEEQVKKASSKQQSTVKQKPIQQNQNVMDKQMKQLQSQKQKPSKKAAFDITSLNSFKIFDDLMDKLTADKEKYRDVLAKKKKFLELASKGGLNGQKYRTLLINSIRDAKDEQIKEGMQFELSQLSDFHDDNVQQWFKDVVSSSELMLQDQQKIMQKLEKGQKVKPKDDSDDGIELSDDDDILVDSDQEVKPAKKQIQKQVIKPQQIKKPSLPQQPTNSSKMGKLGINPNTIFSLKALDEFMSEFQKDPQTFCISFQRKDAIFNMMKKGEITPQRYKELQQTCLKSTTNDKLKEVIEMDLFDLKDMCDNNVNEWFESLVNDAGFSYEDQQARYSKLKGGSSKQSDTVQIVKPNIAEVVCFTAVALLFDCCIQKIDVVYYRELVTKRERLLELVSQKKLVAVKYRQINKATSAKTQNQFLRNAISDEQKLLVDQFKGEQDAWFQQIFKNISKNPPQLKLPENEEMKKVNAWPVDKKKKYLICRMSPYESLLRYYTKHEIPIKNNKNLLEYDKFKKDDTIKALQQLQKNPELDVYNVAEQLFPPIKQNIFYGDTLSDLKKKAEKLPQLLSKEISAIKDYSSKIKKATNPENLEICKKQIAKCEQNIKYLKTWPRDQLVGFPRIKQQKVEKYNLDIVRYLDKNEIEIEITHIQGIKQHLIFKAFVVNDNNARFYADVRSGSQNGIKTIVKLPNRDMAELYRGDKKLIIFRLYQKGFFGGLSLVGEAALQTNFIRNNIIEERIQVGRALFSYVLRIQKPSKPLITELVHYQITVLPAFENDAKVQEELIKKYQSIK